MKGIRLRRRLSVLLGLVVLSGAAAGQTAYEAYYRYLNTYPQTETGFHEDCQGVTTDGSFWYWTQAASKGDPNASDNALWKIPVGMDLSSVSPGGSVTRKIIGNTPLGAAGFWHFGDLSYHSHAGQGFLVMGVEGGSPCDDAIAIFRASDLSYVAHFGVCNWLEHAPWCGVDPDGYLYTSNYDTSSSTGIVKIEKFSVDWDLLSAQPPVLSWQHEDTIDLVDGGTSVALERVQGGVFSPSGELVYLSVWGADLSPCKVQNGGGIHVFHRDSPSSWERIRVSTNGSGLFNFQYDPCEIAPEEPEGLTVWDFDGGQAPGISGQLHVILLDNDWPDGDDVYFKHYTNKIFVPGTSSSVTGGVNLAWDGSVLCIQAGAYPDSFTTSKRIRFQSVGGVAIVGQ